jgi:hypothetical protein
VKVCDFVSRSKVALSSSAELDQEVQGKHAPEQQLTQFGRKRREGSESPFRSKPRPDIDHDGLSLTAGQLTINEMAEIVTKRPAVKGDGVRYTTVAALEKAGFIVKATPNRRNPAHVSVNLPREWDVKDEDAFNRCFGKAKFKRR